MKEEGEGEGEESKRVRERGEQRWMLKLYRAAHNVIIQDRQTDRQTDRQRERERETAHYNCDSIENGWPGKHRIHEINNYNK